MSLFLKEKVEIAIKILQENEPKEGYYLAFSGGKDSIVIYDLAVKARVKFDAHYNVTTVEPPELLKFIKENYPNVIWDRPKYNMLQLIEMHKILPTALVRYCCRYLKEYGGIGRLIVDGVRASESSKRSRRNKIERSKYYDKRFIHIIFDWNNEEVWSYIRINNLKYCKLYDEGYDRIGCIGCPMATRWKRERDFKRYPYLEKAYKNVLKKVFEKYPNKYFGKDVEAYWDWWLSGKSIKEWKQQNSI